MAIDTLIPHDSLLAQTIAAIEPLDQASMEAATIRQDGLTKPAGSLGRLEEISIQMAGIQRKVVPTVERKAVFVCAGDHGVCEEGVSVCPVEVTRLMIYNFIAGGAGINVLGRWAGAEVVVVDVGIASDMGDLPGLVQAKVRLGTRNMVKEPAMTVAETLQALEVGIKLVDDAVANGGLDLVAAGEMGIGNTTPSSALTAAFLGLSAAAVTGRGAGLDDAGLANKVKAVERALALHKLGPDRPIETLAALGGLEIAAMAGIMIAGARHHVGVVVDGFIAGAAATTAAMIAPEVKPYLFGGHQSMEIGHTANMEFLGLKPLLNLNFRLGEGTGAVMAMPIIEAACKVIAEMATLDSVGIDRGA